MAAEPLKSEGGRLERKAVVAKVRRIIRQLESQKGDGTSAYACEKFEQFLAWELKRAARFDVRPGGLGKKASRAR